MPDPDPQGAPHPEATGEAAQRPSVAAKADPYSTQPLNLTRHPSLAATLKLPLGDPQAPSDGTQKLALPVPVEPPLQAGPAETSPRPVGWKLPLALGLLVGLGGLAYLLFVGRPGRALGKASPPPAAIQVYLERAQAGDTSAMRMLGACYYNGLDVPQDRTKGLYWYRKAAENGSEAARSELQQIEGSR
jgi:TPR repeat protein